MYIPYFEGAKSFGISLFFPFSLPRKLDMVEESGNMGSNMAISNQNRQRFNISGCCLHICSLVLNSKQVDLRSQGPNRLSWGCKRVRVWHSKRDGGLWLELGLGLGCPRWSLGLAISLP
jgi:hypothetical protein